MPDSLFLFVGLFTALIGVAVFSIIVVLTLRLLWFVVTSVFSVISTRNNE